MNRKIAEQTANQRFEQIMSNVQGRVNDRTKRITIERVASEFRRFLEGFENTNEIDFGAMLPREQHDAVGRILEQVEGLYGSDDDRFISLQNLYEISLPEVVLLNSSYMHAKILKGSVHDPELVQSRNPYVVLVPSIDNTRFRAEQYFKDNLFDRNMRTFLYETDDSARIREVLLSGRYPVSILR